MTRYNKEFWEKVCRIGVLETEPPSIMYAIDQAEKNHIYRIEHQTRQEAFNRAMLVASKIDPLGLMKPYTNPFSDNL